MTPLSVRATNYGPFAEVRWTIQPGLTSVVARNESGNGADSNGSGKTKLLELIPICLFGPPRPWSEYLTWGGEETTCLCEMEFSHAGETYRVRRTYDAKGRGKTLLDLERLDLSDIHAVPDAPAQVWKSITADKQDETQALLESIIGMTEATFNHSVFAGQGARHFSDPSLPPRERKAILVEALNLGIWDKLKKLIDADITDIKTALAGIEQRLVAFSTDLDAKPQVEAEVADLREQAAVCDATVIRFEQAETETRAKHEHLNHAVSERQLLESRLGIARERLATFNQATREASEANAALMSMRTDLTRLETLAERAPELVAQVNAITVADSTREQAERERRNLLSQAVGEEARAEEASAAARSHREKADALRALTDAKMNGNPGSCDHCGQALAGEALKQSIASLIAGTQALTLVVDRYLTVATDASTKGVAIRVQAAQIILVDPPKADRATLHRETLAAQQAETEVVRIRAQIPALQEKIAKVDTPEWLHAEMEADTTLKEAQQALEASPSLNPEALASAGRDLERAHSDLTVIRSTSRTLAGQLATSEERLRNLAALTERSQEALLARAGLQGRLDVLTALARSYGRDGIPVLLLEALAIPHLETEANKLLDQMDTRMRFELVTQRETKVGGLKDTLDVLVHGERGTLRYESYSGGEQTRLAFCLQIALARLVVQNGAEAGILVLDEMTFLDATGIAKMCEVLRGLTEFRSIVVVSHDERFVEAFDQVVTVIRDDLGSRLEEVA